MATTLAIDPMTLESARAFLDIVRRDYPVLEARLYGSRARGDYQPDSDVDVAVILGGAKRRRVDVALEMVDLAQDILLDTGIYISPFPVWKSEWDNPELMFNPWLIRNIKVEGIAL